MPALPKLPQSALDYSRRQRLEIQAAVSSVTRQWARMGPEFDQSYARLEPTLLAVVRVAQTRVSAGARGYIPAVLDETGQSASVDAFASVSTRGLIGVAGDGRPVDSLLYESVIGAKVRVGAGASPAQALAAQGQWLTSAVGTLLSDTGRQSESLHMGVRPVTGYVRMLNAPSCSRCVVLAGKFYKRNAGFDRHPRCDCRHIPSTESLAGDMTVDPVAYFDSLTKAEQDKTFGAAGGEALRSGANMGQVVNARRGMTTAQVGGRKILTTTEGTTKRGVANKVRGGNKKPRLMPEQIQAIATDRADYLRLLSVNGFMG